MEKEYKDKSPNKQNSNQNDEIDLIELFSIIGDKFNQFFQNIWNGVLTVLIYLYTKIYKFKIAVIIAVIVGGALGYLSKNTSQFYASKATVNSRFLTGVDFIKEIEELNALCTDEGRPMLAKSLNLPLLIVESISEISSKGYYMMYKSGKVNPEMADSLYLESLDNETRFELEVKTSVQEITKAEIQKGFEFFFNKNQFIIKNQEIYKQNLNSKKKTFEKEQLRLQEFNEAYKEIIVQQGELLKKGLKPSSSNVVVMKNSQDDGYIRQSGELAFEAMENQQKVEDSLAFIRTEIALIQPVEFVNRFSELYTVSLSTGGKTIIGMFIGFLVVLGFSILLDLNSFMKKKANL
ncbi:hypothetical protein [Flammeovirga kamogawensis]|uniref:Uncharacterized protein n=1 Tax=Flammeovirga kamogawensis TaxID=373891 RepID=A0ABX8GT00_9BACT|nr:hypothetical protein [Flammeovirga kamogawensis]MBB6461516.1 hypothetical protein [Flammeovirga kamogawensis]QWG06407.1 hypothetical protein KM029_13840 [Flammeovirga kamogawensis]TRX68237.1 hypothetical protein EO216_08855 [Flammeovirga kamogawensis]